MWQDYYFDPILVNLDLQVRKIEQLSIEYAIVDLKPPNLVFTSVVSTAK